MRATRSGLPGLKPSWAVCFLVLFHGDLTRTVRSAETGAKEPPLRVTVDPRVELISVIFRLAGNPEYSQGRVESYTEDVEKQFGALRNHPAVELARNLRRTRGVSYDACMSMAVHVSDASKLAEKAPLDPWPESLDRRWGIDGAREFLPAARQFVKDTSFPQFIDAHRKLYEVAESRARAILEKDGHLAWFDEFFGQRPQASFTVALGLLNGGSSYGPHCRTADDKEELFCILGVWKTDGEGLPAFDRDVLGTVVHEFCCPGHALVGVRQLEDHDLRIAGPRLRGPLHAAALRPRSGPAGPPGPQENGVPLDRRARGPAGRV
jgi:hypothetical protein